MRWGNKIGAYKAPFLDFDLSLTNGIVLSEIYDRRNDFNFETVKFPFLDVDVLRFHVYI